MPQQAQAPPGTITIDFSFIASPAFKGKLPIIVIILVLFAFSGVMLSRANLSIADAFDVPRYEFNVAKLYSVSFLLFIALFAVTVALATVYGYGLSMGAAVMLLAALALVSLIMSLVLPGMMWPLFILAASIAAASAAGSTKPKLTFFSAWNASGKAMTVLLILLFAYSAAVANANKDAYVDTLLSGAAEFTPQLQQQVTAVCGQAILGALDQNLNAQAIGEKLRSSVPRETVKANLLLLCPQLTNLNSAQQDALIDLSYGQVTNMATSMVGGLKQGIQDMLKPNETVTEDQEINVTAAQQQVADLRAKVFEVPQAQMLYDLLPLIVGLLVASTAYVTKFVIQPVASIVCFVLAKL